MKRAAEVHPTAVVAEEARIGAGVEIGPYSVIGPDVAVGEGTRIASHVVLEGHTRIGRNCRIGKGACIGTPPQDRKHKGERSYVHIGDDNEIREFVTVNCGSTAEAVTRIGDRNYLMIGVHVGHDCQVGSDVTIANGTGLAGFSVVEDRAVIGGIVGVHQHCRIGKGAMVGALTKVVLDVPPFSVCDGNPAKLYGLNSIGLKRAGYSLEDMALLKRALKMLFRGGLSKNEAVAAVLKEGGSNADVLHLVEFVRASKRGVLRAVAEE
jgi:UDP-N-acetylglucosamine acyltransferase